MKILYINGNSGGSTGTIIKSLREYASKFDFETFLVSYNDSNKTADYIAKGNCVYELANRVLCRIDGSDGFHNVNNTKKLIQYIDSIKPDIIHIHTIHGHFLNIEMLLEYINKNNIKTIWTLHDCWAFTGRCSHFVSHDCYKWKTQCSNCPAKKEYPSARIIDHSRKLFLRKKKLFSSLDGKITFVVPSEWLYKTYKDSMLQEFPCRIINNGINMAQETVSTERSQDEKQIIFFSAAYPFTKEKGIDIISKLAESLDENKFKFVVAGLTKKESSRYSKKILSVGIIHEKKLMDYYYSSSDYFLNPSFQDTFPTVNIESLKNGTPVITFNSGGSPEILSDETGEVIQRGDYGSLKAFICNNAKHKSSFDIKKCKERASLFSDELMVEKYFSLYKEILK